MKELTLQEAMLEILIESGLKSENPQSELESITEMINAFKEIPWKEAGENEIKMMFKAAFEGAELYMTSNRDADRWISVEEMMPNVTAWAVKDPNGSILIRTIKLEEYKAMGAYEDEFTERWAWALRDGYTCVQVEIREVKK